MMVSTIEHGTEMTVASEREQRCRAYYFSGHAVQRMFEKNISKEDVLTVIANGSVIATYSDDKPFPSFLKLGFVNERPIHVVFAVDEESGTCHVITVYPPDPDLWNNDFKSRRKR